MRHLNWETHGRILGTGWTVLTRRVSIVLVKDNEDWLPLGSSVVVNRDKNGRAEPVLMRQCRWGNMVETIQLRKTLGRTLSVPLNTVFLQYLADQDWNSFMCRNFNLVPSPSQRRWLNRRQLLALRRNSILDSRYLRKVLTENIYPRKYLSLSEIMKWVKKVKVNEIQTFRYRETKHFAVGCKKIFSGGTRNCAWYFDHRSFSCNTGFPLIAWNKYQDNYDGYRWVKKILFSLAESTSYRWSV